MSRTFLRLLLLFCAIWTATSTGALAETTSPWVRNLPNNHGVIVFVHGVTGDSRTTWTSGTKFWPAMLARDATFDSQNIYVYSYPSPWLKKTFSIDEVADNMRLVLTTDGVFKHDQIIFVCHSMGGIVTRALILKYRYIIPKIRLVYFFATPTTGSPYAVLANIFSSNSQFTQLYPMQSDSYLGPLQSSWLAADLKLKSYCAYETQPYWGHIIVTRESATNLCTQRLDPIDANHVDIVKPTDQYSTSYRALKAAFLETEPSPKHITPHPSRAKIDSGTQALSPKLNNAGTRVVTQAGNIIAAHYPTGELFAVEPNTGSLRLLSARLGNISGLVIRKNGEIVILDNHIDGRFGLIIGVNPKTGYHRDIGVYQWASFAQQALTLESDDTAIVALDGALVRADLNTGQVKLLTSNNLLRGASGVVCSPSGEILVTVIPDKVLRVNPQDGAITVLTEGGLLWHPRAPTIENSHSILVGTTAGAGGKLAGVVRINLKTGSQEIVATGPFETVAGIAIDSEGSVFVADNGRGSPGDGFIARLDPQSRRVNILVSAETSDWKFLNGRSIAVFPVSHSN